MSMIVFSFLTVWSIASALVGAYFRNELLMRVGISGAIASAGLLVMSWFAAEASRNPRKSLAEILGFTKTDVCILLAFLSADAAVIAVNHELVWPSGICGSAILVFLLASWIFKLKEKNLGHSLRRTCSGCGSKLKPAFPGEYKPFWVGQIWRCPVCKSIYEVCEEPHNNPGSEPWLVLVRKELS